MSLYYRNKDGNMKKVNKYGLISNDKIRGQVNEYMNENLQSKLATAVANDTTHVKSSELANKVKDCLNEQLYPILENEIGVINTSYKYGDVRRYGAVGDGVTDDTKALQIAFKNSIYNKIIITLEKDKTYIMRSGVNLGSYSYLDGNGATILIDKISSFTDDWDGNFKNQFFMDNGYNGNIKVFDWKNVTIDFSPELITKELITEGDTSTQPMLIFRFYDCEEFRMTNVNIICDGDDRNAIHPLKFCGHGKIFMDNCNLKNTQRYKENGSILWIQSSLEDGYYARINNCNFYCNCWDEIISIFCTGSHDIIIDKCNIEKYWYDTYYNANQELAYDFCGFFLTNNYLTPTTFTDEEIAKIYHNVLYSNCKMTCKPINEESTIGILGITAFGNYYATPSTLKFENCDIDIQNLCMLIKNDSYNVYNNNIEWKDNMNTIFDNCNIRFSKFIGNRGIVRSNSSNLTIQNSKMTLDKYIYNQSWVESNICTCFHLYLFNNQILVKNSSSSLFSTNPLSKETYKIIGNDFITLDSDGNFIDTNLLTESTTSDGYDSENVIFNHIINATYKFSASNNRINGKIINSKEDFNDVINAYLFEDVEGTLHESSNLLPLEDGYTATKYGVTVSTSGQLITINGTWTATWNEAIAVTTITLPAGDYRFSIWNIENLTDATLLGLQIMKGTNYACALQNLANDTQSKFTLTEETELTIYLKCLVGFVAENTTMNFMLATGLDATTQYEEYFQPYYEGTKCIKEEYVKPFADKANAGINGNVLYGKKWAVCGDSFSNGDFANATDTNYIIEDGLYKGKNKVYGYLIGNRNNMTIQNLAVGGRTMATPADGTFTNCFSYDGIYNSIDADTDYITLYFGINDSHHRSGATGSDGEDTEGVIELGTIDDADNTTFYGAWNVVLDYLIANYPNAHIGIIVSNGCETDDYRIATIEVAKKYGIPYIDLNGDERTPCMIRSTNTSIAESVRTARTKQWAVNYGTNNHPNAQAHEYQSKFIESFLRSL